MNIELTSKVSIDAERLQQSGMDPKDPAARTGQAQKARAVAEHDEQGQQKHPVVEQNEQQRKPERKEIAAVLEELNQAIPLRARQLEFALDEGANRTVISVLDKESGDVIRQIPSQEALDLATRLRELSQEGAEQAVGVLVNSQI